MLRHGADPNLKDKEGRNALTYAFEQRAGNDILEYLIDAGAELEQTLELPDGTRGTPLHYAAIEQNSFILNRLIRSGAKVNSETSVGKTPLQLAFDEQRHGAFYYPVILELVQGGADLSIKDSSGFDSYDLAVKHGGLLFMFAKI